MQNLRIRPRELLIAGALLLVAPATSLGQTAKPDYYIKTFTATVSGNDVTLSASLCNKGAAGTKDVELEFYRNRSTAPGCTTFSTLGKLIKNGLAAGACATVTTLVRNVGPGSYRAWARADADCTIAEVSEVNNNASATYAVTRPIPRPDYYIKSYATAVSGGDVTHTVEVCNRGATTFTTTFLDVYRNRTSLPACRSLADHFFTVFGLAAGACKTYTWVDRGVSVGSFTAVAVADSFCTLTESDETNNLAAAAYTVSSGTTRPDYQVTRLSAAIAGNKVTLTATVCNTGQAGRTSFDIELYHARTAPPTCATTSFAALRVVGGLAAGACRTVSRQVPGLVYKGSYTGWARADADCEVNESNEANNNRSTTYTVTATAPKPDFTVASLTSSVTGNDVALTARICNTGSAASSRPIEVELYGARATAPGCNTSADAVATVAAGLAAGACKTVTATILGVDKGAHTAWARADANCRIKELSETNNNRSTSYTVARALTPPDITLSGFTATPSGNDVAFRATVCNGGGSTGRAFDVEFYGNLTAVPDCSTVASTEVRVPGLAAGACKTVTSRLLVAPQGTFTAGARADADCEVAEADEGNNDGGATYTTAQAYVAPDLYIKRYTAVVKGNRVTHTVEACNRGGSVARTFYIDLYLGQATEPTCADVGSHTYPVNGLAAGSCVTRTLTEPSVPAGGYSSWAVVDSTPCMLNEPVESDNARLATYTVTAARPVADLTVRTFKATVSGLSITYDIDVCNTGAADSSRDTWLYLFRDRPDAPGCRFGPGHEQARDTAWLLPRITPGRCVHRSYTTTGVLAGSYTAYAMADARCEEYEAAEANNVKSASYTIPLSPGMPDLVVRRFRNTTSGATVTYDLEICNQGTVTATGADLRLYLDQAKKPACGAPTELGAEVPITVAAGACIRAQVPIDLPAGSYRSWLVLDGACTLFEGNEQNNARSTLATVHQDCDLDLRQLQMTSSGGTTSVAMQVCNNGTATCRPFKLSIWYQQTSAPTCTTPDADLTATIEDLPGKGSAPGNCVILSGDITPPSGTLTSWVLLDSACEISENFELDNVLSTKHTVP